MIVSQNDQADQLDTAECEKQDVPVVLPAQGENDTMTMTTALPSNLPVGRVILLAVTLLAATFGMGLGLFFLSSMPM